MDQPPDLEKFNNTVWEIVRQVPRGIVTTYGQIASMIPCPDNYDPGHYERLCPRWVGNAMNAVSAVSGVDDPSIPWHRVINSKGGISLLAETKAGQLQRSRLRHEGVEFNAKEQVDFRKVGWTGPAETWLEENELVPPRRLFEDEPPAEDQPSQLSLF